MIRTALAAALAAAAAAVSAPSAAALVPSPAPAPHAATVPVHVPAQDADTPVVQPAPDQPADADAQAPGLGTAAPAADGPALANPESDDSIDAVRPATAVYLWGDRVRVHSAPSTRAPVLATLNHQWLDGVCQSRAETVTVPGVGRSAWWVDVLKRGGSDDAWVTALYLDGGRSGAMIPGVPLCRDKAAPQTPPQAAR